MSGHSLILTLINYQPPLKEVEGVEGDKIEENYLQMALKNLKRIQVILRQLMNV